MIEFIDVADGNELIEKKGVWPSNASEGEHACALRCSQADMHA